LKNIWLRIVNIHKLTLLRIREAEVDFAGFYPAKSQRRKNRNRFITQWFFLWPQVQDSALAGCSFKTLDAPTPSIWLVDLHPIIVTHGTM
jgi:hypothetical protein